MMEDFYTVFIRTSIVGLIGLVFWFAKIVYIEVKKMQKHRYRSEAIDDKVQDQLKEMRESQKQLKQDMALLLSILLNKKGPD